MKLEEQIEQELKNPDCTAKTILQIIRPYWLERVGRLEREIERLQFPPTKQEVLLFQEYNRCEDLYELVHKMWLWKQKHNPTA